jgi:hypothetical protein
LAYQHADKRKGAQVLRTPAPVEQLDRQHGQGGYGQAGDTTPSSIPPGTALNSLLAANLRESQADSEDVLSQVIAKGVAGRGDDIPADGNGQLRAISPEMYPTAFGMKRQQAPDFWSKGGDHE